MEKVYRITTPSGKTQQGMEIFVVYPANASSDKAKFVIGQNGFPDGWYGEWLTDKQLAKYDCYRQVGKEEEILDTQQESSFDELQVVLGIKVSSLQEAETFARKNYEGFKE